eukprot:TRINITY_DN32328_c0_g1_i1.p1 TRINITY_DN32328_c0_g1~~TRINITY_DN32328_c0_g1_i1.p1  ORF type:complete len:661 (+),score=125.69 TRINITY_DN32328_c0_g1_i1:97-1983(+)
MALHKYPASEVLRGPYALDEFNSGVVAEYMSTLTPQNALIFLTSDAFKSECQADDAAEKGWQQETWYKAFYKKEAFSSEKLEGWKEALKASLGGEESGLQLPVPNRFIPQDFSLDDSPVAEGPALSKLPVEVLPPSPIVADPMLRVWHKTDKAFKTPREYVLAHVHTGAYEMGPDAVVMMRLFCNVVIDDLNAFAYDAQCAGLNYSLDFADNLSISVGGFNDKLPELWKVVVSRMGEVLDAAEKTAEALKAATNEEEAQEALGERGEELLERLEVARQILLQDYNNFTREEPWSVSNYYSSQLMMRKSWHLREYIEVLEKPPDLGLLASWVRKALSKIQIDVFVHGNVTKDESKAAADTLRNAFEADLGSEVLPSTRQKEVTKLPLESATVFEYDLAAQNPAQENCCTQNIYEVGPVHEDPHRDACITLACHIAGVSCYQKLRTEEQLGYIVQSYPWVENHVAGLAVLVQGNRMPPKEVDKRIEEWLTSFGEELEKMSDEEFQNNVQAVVSERTQRYSRMAQETNRHWGEIVSRRYKFDRLAATVKMIKAVKKEDVQAFFKEYLAAKAPSRRKLSMRVLGTSAGENATSEPDGPSGVVLNNLEEIREFQAKSEEFYLSPPHAEMPPVA